MYESKFQPEKPLVTIEFEGTPLQVPEGISVAAAILGHAGKCDCRSSFISGEKRSGFCFMGVCHECFVEIDGRPNQQGCVTLVRPGMRIRRQHVVEGE